MKSQRKREVAFTKKERKRNAQICSEKREPKRKWAGTRKEETLTICTSKVVGHKKGKRKKGAKLTINAIWKIAGVSKLRMSTSLQGKGQEVEMARLREERANDR